ncbi:MAG: pyrroline-5-carboxylate reductase [Henriciella sp.]
MAENNAKNLTLFGAGRMGSALAGGWLKSGYGGQITLVDPNPSETVQAWVDAGKVALNGGPHASDILVVAVKPQMFIELAPNIASWIGPETDVLSIMAGVPLATLEAKLGTSKVARAMPNTPGLVGMGVTVMCLPQAAASGVEVQTRALLQPLGSVEGPISEDLLPAATAVSGCGPAYGFLLAELMAQAGAANGLDPDMSMRLARRTVEGAGALMAASDQDARTLRENVTSPGGVTQAALAVLMADNALPKTLREAVAAAIKRDRELSAETS